MHNKLLFSEKTIILKKGRNFIGGHCIIFSFFFGLVMCHKPQTCLMVVEKMYIMYILCTLILSNPLHLTIGSTLTLIQNEL
jgi:hypothetical protein